MRKGGKEERRRGGEKVRRVGEEKRYLRKRGVE